VDIHAANASIQESRTRIPPDSLWRRRLANIPHSKVVAVVPLYHLRPIGDIALRS
jgi:hypothetical protein